MRVRDKLRSIINLKSLFFSFSKIATDFMEYNSRLRLFCQRKFFIQIEQKLRLNYPYFLGRDLDKAKKCLLTEKYFSTKILWAM